MVIGLVPNTTPIVRLPSSTYRPCQAGEQEPRITSSSAACPLPALGLQLHHNNSDGRGCFLLPADLVDEPLEQPL